MNKDNLGLVRSLRSLQGGIKLQQEALLNGQTGRERSRKLAALRGLGVIDSKVTGAVNLGESPAFWGWGGPHSQPPGS